MRPRQQASGDFKPVPVGAHIAVCTGLVDIGYQGGGQFEPAFKVVISWQLPNQLSDSGKPLTISQTYTNSMNKKANLRKLIESWFGKALPSEEAANNFELKALLGRACMVNVVHKESNGKTFANVNTVMPIPAGIPKPEAPKDFLYYSPTDDGASEEEISRAYAALPEWLRKKVDAQLPPNQAEGVAAEVGAEAAAAANQPEDGDIPF